jgi:hypothetical protein
MKVTLKNWSTSNHRFVIDRIYVKEGINNICYFDFTTENLSGARTRISYSNYQMCQQVLKKAFPKDYPIEVEKLWAELRKMCEGSENAKTLILRREK